jgi:hypothetical protein
MPDSNIREYFESIDRVLALNWDQMIAGHPRQGGIGKKEDVRALKRVPDRPFQRGPTGQCGRQMLRSSDQKGGRYEEFLPSMERIGFDWRNGWE